MFSNIKDQELVFRNLIDGNWTNSKSGKFIEIYSPIDNSLVGKVPAMTTEEVDYTFKCAKKAQDEWKNTPINKRAEVLYKAENILEEKVKDLTQIMMLEIGKDKKSCESEIIRTADFIRFTADASKSLSGESIPGDSFPGFKKNKISVIKESLLE